MSTFQRTSPPNPNWTFGQTVDTTESGKAWLAGLKSGWQTFDPLDTHPLHTYSLLLSGITPRPVAFVSTTSEEGVDNIAPYSFFTVASADPPVISFTSDSRQGLKDSAKNALTTKEFVVNIISEPWIEQANAACMDSPFGQEEWGFAGLSKEPSEVVKPPRVRESGFSMECELFNHVQIVNPATGKVASEVIFGAVKRIHVRQDLLTFTPHTQQPQVDVALLKPISRLGDISYGTIGSAFRLTRPEWKTEKEAALEAANKRSKRDLV